MLLPYSIWCRGEQARTCVTFGNKRIVKFPKARQSSHFWLAIIPYDLSRTKRFPFAKGEKVGEESLTTFLDNK